MSTFWSYAGGARGEHLPIGGSSKGVPSFGRSPRFGYAGLLVGCGPAQGAVELAEAVIAVGVDVDPIGVRDSARGDAEAAAYGLARTGEGAYAAAGEQRGAVSCALNDGCPFERQAESRSDNPAPE